MLDVVRLLDEYGIEYSEQSSHKSKGWINVKCLFCDDHSDHLGINIEQGSFHCYICGTKGGKFDLIRAVSQVNDEEEVVQIIRKFQMKDSSGSRISRTRSYSAPTRRNFAVKCNLPTLATPFLPELHASYLRRRGFDPDYLTKKYNLHACYMSGDYKYRIIIPIYYEHKLVSFTSRDVTGIRVPKYLNSKISESILDPKSCIYNTDHLDKSMLVLEGPADVWRIGDGAVCTFGTEVSEAQINLFAEIIKRKEIRKIMVMFDPEPTATKKAKDLALVLSSFAKDVAVVEYESDKDPGDFMDEEVKQVRMTVF
jgi:DNA primase